MAEVTDADWNKAIDILDGEGLMPMNTGTIGSIAAALAEEREKARAPFLALAQEAERKGVASSFRDFAGNPWPAQIYPHDIRRAAEENR